MRRLTILCLAMTSLMLGSMTVATARVIGPRTASTFLFGVINDEGQHFDDEWQRGVRATTLELHWFHYEPQEGVYDIAYVARMQQRLQALKAQGWVVQLVPGYQYVPSWVFENYPDMRYVNQYGEAYTPAAGSFNVINAPFNPQARTLIARYLQRIFEDFDAADFDSVRVGGGVQGELRYPPPDWNGRHNAYWAFDVYAQDPAVSGIATDVAGWRPGIDPNPGSVGRGQLIANGDFEALHERFPIPAWAPDYTLQAALENNSAQEGQRALRVSIADGGRVQQYVPVSSDMTYEFSAWMRTADAGTEARVYVTQIDAQNEVVAGAAYGQLASSSTEWAQDTGTLRTSRATRYLKVELAAEAPGTFYFDDLQLLAEAAPNALDRDLDTPLAFYDWYVAQLSAYQQWQIDVLRQYYDGQLDLVYAGKGLLPNQVTHALNNDLRGDGWAETSSALYSAAVYGWHTASLRETRGMALYLTGIEEPPLPIVDDGATTPNRWSAARWMAFLAQEKGIPVWGENGGQNSAEEMALAVQRMRENGFLGLMWAFESELYAVTAGYATIDDYERWIRVTNNPLREFLPLLMR
jgi:hypothetical protein